MDYSVRVSNVFSFLNSGGGSGQSAAAKKKQKKKADEKKAETAAAAAPAAKYVASPVASDSKEDPAAAVGGEFQVSAARKKKKKTSKESAEETPAAVVTPASAVPVSSPPAVSVTAAVAVSASKVAEVKLPVSNEKKIQENPKSAAPQAVNQTQPPAQIPAQPTQPAAAAAPALEEGETLVKSKKDKRKAKKEATESNNSPTNPAAEKKSAEPQVLSPPVAAAPVQNAANHHPTLNELISSSSTPTSSSFFDRLALALDPLNRDSAVLLDSWAERLEKYSNQLNSSNAAAQTPIDKELVEFHRFYYESQALEIIVRRLINEVYNKSENLHAPALKSFDASLVRLLTASLTGKSHDYKWLVEQIRSLARQLDGALSRDQFIEKFVKMLAAQKKIELTQAEIRGVIKLIDTDRTEKHSILSPQLLESSINSELEKSNVNLLEFFGSAAPNDPLRKLWAASVTIKQEIGFTESRLLKFSSILGKSPQHNLQLTFHLLEKEIQDKLAASQSQVDQQENQKTFVLNQKTQLEANKKTELSGLLLAETNFADRDRELNKRKKILLDELKSVDNSLAILVEARKKNNDQIKTIQDNYGKGNENLTNLIIETEKKVVGINKDKSAAEQIHTIIVSTYERLSEISSAHTKKISTANRESLTNYLCLVRDYVLTSHGLIEFLTERTKFCGEKLKLAQEEKRQFANFGLSDAIIDQSGSIEKQMQSMMKQDSRVSQFVSAQVQSLFAKLAVLVTSQHQNASAADLLTAVNGILATLEAKKVTVELGKLRAIKNALVDQAQSAAAKANEKQSQINAREQKSNHIPSEAKPAADSTGSAKKPEQKTPSKTTPIQPKNTANGDNQQTKAAAAPAPTPVAEAVAPAPIAVTAATANSGASDSVVATSSSPASASTAPASASPSAPVSSGSKSWSSLLAAKK